MKNKLSYLSFCILIVLMASVVFSSNVVLAAVPVPQDNGRDQLINDELESAARRLESNGHSRFSADESQSIVIDKDITPEPVIQAVEDVESFEPVAEAVVEVSDNKIDRERLKKIELALQWTSHYYKTDKNRPYYYDLLYASSDPDNQAKKSGLLSGVYAAYTYRRPTTYSVHNIKDLMESEGNPFFTFARAEVELSFGNVDYDSYASGKTSNASAWQGNFRLLAGYDFLSPDESLMITPYVGFGYRRVTDEAGGWVDTIVYNHMPYESRYQYFYLPFGVETLKQVNSDWDISFKLEGAVLLSGNVELGLSDIPGLYSATDLDTGLPITIAFRDSDKIKVKSGFGVKTSLKAIKKLQFYNVFVEPFFEMWRMSKSDSKAMLSVSTADQYYYSAYPDGSEYKPLYEPASYTFDVGLRLGMQF
jgi:hypothetical protein